MALGWLLLLHLLADLAVALYRCTAINPLLTDTFARALMRAQFGLLCVWLFAGKDPSAWRLAGFLSGSAGMFVVYSRLIFPGFHKPSLGPAWFRSDFDLYFRSTGPGDLLLKAPLMLALIARRADGLSRRRFGNWSVIIRRSVASRIHSRTDRAHRLQWLQFSMADYLIWSFTLGLVMMVFTVAPYHEGWLELVRWRRGLGLQGKIPDSHLMLGAAIPVGGHGLAGELAGPDDRQLRSAGRDGDGHRPDLRHRRRGLVERLPSGAAAVQFADRHAASFGSLGPAAHRHCGGGLVLVGFDLRRAERSAGEIGDFSLSRSGTLTIATAVWYR